jgi:hypothetical protein
MVNPSCPWSNTTRADECLGADDLPGVDGHDRLVVQEELVPRNRSLELGAQREPVEHSGVQARVVAYDLAFAETLGRIEREIGAAQQPGQVQACFSAGGQDHAGAGAGQGLFTLHGERVSERGEQPVYEAIGLRRVGDVLDEDRELVATDSSHGGARPQVVLQPAGDVDQHLVAGGMAAGVVDVLEAVDVDHHDGEERSQPGSSGQRLFGSVGEQDAVGQTGQGIVESLVRELLLQRAAF